MTKNRKTPHGAEMTHLLVDFFGAHPATSAKRLHLLLYLADLYSVKWTKKPLTHLRWTALGGLPHSQELEEFLGEPRPAAKDAGQLSTSLRLMLENIRTPWGDCPLEDLESYIQTTAPFSVCKPEDHDDLDLMSEYHRTSQRLAAGEL